MRLLILLAALLASVALSTCAAAQPADTLAGRFVVFSPQGTPAPLNALIMATQDVDVLFLGEQHDDRTTHALQHRLLDALLAGRRPVVLALEMFERDVQLVLDEYLAGHIRERDFLAAARPWSNYRDDYRPLVEAAREAGTPVIASNAPARYVNRVARLEGAGLDSLAGAALAVLPDRPVPPPSDSLAARFRRTMAEMAEAHGGHSAMPGMPSIDGLLAAQNLRDASMGAAIAQALDAHPGALVVHVNGAFHSEDGLGTPEHLARLQPEARWMVVTMRPSAALAEPPAVTGDDWTVKTAR